MKRGLALILFAGLLFVFSGCVGVVRTGYYDDHPRYYRSPYYGYPTYRYHYYDNYYPYGGSFYFRYRDR